MRRTGAAWAAVLLCVAVVGCLPRSDGLRRTSRAPGESALPLAAPDGLYVASLLLEQPLGDLYLDRDLWESGLAVPSGSPETQVLLTENGLRAIVLGGNLPPVFQKLIGSEVDTVSPRRLTFANRKDDIIPTAEMPDPCEYEVLTDVAGMRKPVKLRQARAGVLVRPTMEPDGRVKVWCEPRVQHGDRREWLRPTADATGFTIQGEVPVVAYPTLGFEVTVGPGDYLLIGSSAAATGTLGLSMFEVEVDGRPRQRVLVMRFGRHGDPIASDLPTIANLRRPSIAAEASSRR